MRKAETHLEHLAITRTTVTSLADRLPAAAPDLPEHPDYPRILAAFNHATGPIRAKDVCQALGHEMLPKNVEGNPPHPHRRRAGRPLLRRQQEDNAEHRRVRARVEHTFARMKNWKILCDCRQKGDGLHHAVATVHNLAMTG